MLFVDHISSSVTLEMKTIAVWPPSILTQKLAYVTAVRSSKTNHCKHLESVDLCFNNHCALSRMIYRSLILKSSVDIASVRLPHLTAEMVGLLILWRTSSFVAALYSRRFQLLNYLAPNTHWRKLFPSCNVYTELYWFTTCRGVEISVHQSNSTVILKMRMDPASMLSLK